MNPILRYTFKSRAKGEVTIRSRLGEACARNAAMRSQMCDCGNAHVIDWHLWLATRPLELLSERYTPLSWRFNLPAWEDFDIITEQREGWAYGDHR